MKTPELCCALLDLGNVLVKIDLSRLGERVQSLTGIGPDQLRAAFAADNLFYRYESGHLGSVEFHAELCRRISREMPWDQFVAAWNSIFLPEPILDDELLTRLASKLDLWIISNTNPIHFDYIRENYDFFRHFRGFVLSHEAGALKPDPAIFAHAVERTGFEAARTLFVDDQSVNVEAACTLGFQAFQFLGAARIADQLRSLGLFA
jgi:FMN phosphatase YigB (HAD superfamily)